MKRIDLAFDANYKYLRSLAIAMQYRNIGHRIEEHTWDVLVVGATGGLGVALLWYTQIPMIVSFVGGCAIGLYALLKYHY